MDEIDTLKKAWHWLNAPREGYVPAAMRWIPPAVDRLLALLVVAAVLAAVIRWLMDQL